MSSSAGAMSNRRDASVSANGRRRTSISCNRCRKPLTTTLFVVACDCVFCEECTYDHFQSHTSCPCCRKELGNDDFLELIIADPSPSSQESTKNCFQTLFTKSSSSSKILRQQEMCTRLLRALDDNRRLGRFLLKQTTAGASSEAARSGDIGRAYENLKEQMTQLKQSTNSQRLQSEQSIADLKNRLQALTCTVQEKESQIMQKDAQIARYKELIRGENLACRPSSAQSDSSRASDGKRGPGRPSMTAMPPGYHQRSRQSVRPVSNMAETTITPIHTLPSKHANYSNRPPSADSTFTFDASIGGGMPSLPTRNFAAPRSYSFGHPGGNSEGGSDFLGMRRSRSGW